MTAVHSSLLLRLPARRHPPPVKHVFSGLILLPPAPPHNVSAGLPSLKPETAQPREEKPRSPVSDGDSLENKAASTLMQAGTLFSSDNATENSVNYARSVGEGLINQQVNEWLNQFGNAKLSLDSDRKVSGDILVQIYDGEKNLLFFQLGLRNNGERDTVNAGLGYVTGLPNV